MDIGNLILTVVTLAGTATMAATGFFLSNAYNDIKLLRKELSDLLRKVDVTEAKTVQRSEMYEVVKAMEKAVNTQERLYYELTQNVVRVETDADKSNEALVAMRKDIDSIREDIAQVRKKLHE